jgi:hypothetical protein
MVRKWFELADSLKAAYKCTFEFRPNEIGLAARAARLTNAILPDLEPTGCVNTRPIDISTKEALHG